MNLILHLKIQNSCENVSTVNKGKDKQFLTEEENFLAGFETFSTTKTFVYLNSR